MWGSAFWAVLLLQRREGSGESLKNTGAQGYEVKLAFTAGFDDSGGLELLDVMRECGRRDGHSLKYLGAAHRALSGRDALEKFEAARIGESFENRSAAIAA